MYHKSTHHQLKSRYITTTRACPQTQRSASVSQLTSTASTETPSTKWRRSAYSNRIYLKTVVQFVILTTSNLVVRGQGAVPSNDNPGSVKGV